ncbi:pseudouridine synthase [Aliivibrio finisterrensis]|uniref:pseudouridine synthase n=1 Tax=Aliivibrio finisterrensis TaxID=511998 RepID=UPI00101EF7D5|nr:pseudouridine synthase [Aliivibrio finisterrensis]RYU68827.1 pseudouridine synthase [Aliivibrio finisterrensis]RYU72771.1 pseudouridine synthase [Aliivibrio finisterrensis]RYU72980.1 pseudouridine synthase [Aliivibrio finisterrensis]
MRLDKFICKSTELTKTQAVELILEGRAKINSDVVTLESTQVHENNQVTLNGKELVARPFRYILMNKPANTICSNIDEAYPSLFNYIEEGNNEELHIAGRLDADTTGLVLITDDGHWSYNIITPNKKCEKVYRVGLRKPIVEDAEKQFAEGVQLQGELQLTRPAKLDIITPQEVLLTITEGKFHQVKRMFSAIGNKVVSLHRKKIGSISLDVNEGQWRYLTEEEVNSFSK